MFKKFNIIRLAAAALIAGASIAATGGAAHADGDLDRLFQTPPKRAQNNLPGFEQPAPRRINARTYFVGTWTVTMRDGSKIYVRFLKNGTYALISTKEPNKIEVGRWAIRGGKLALLIAAKCDRQDTNNCTRIQQPKLVTVAFRIVNRNRAVASGGVFTREV